MARASLSTVLLLSAAGRPLAPTPATISEAPATARWDAARQFHAAYAPPQGAEAYPLTATVFAVMHRRPMSRARQNRALGFFEAALS